MINQLPDSNTTMEDFEDNALKAFDSLIDYLLGKKMLDVARSALKEDGKK